MTIRRILSFTGCFLIVCLSSAFVRGEPLTFTPEKAKAVVSQYCTFLKNGDSASILDILGGALLEKRKFIFGKPDYDELLIHRYSNSEFIIKTVTKRSDRETAVDIVIVFPNGNLQLKRFIVAPIADSLKIINEDEYY